MADVEVLEKPCEDRMEADIKTLFDEQGFIGPVALFTRKECQLILARLQRSQEVAPRDWEKAWAVTSPDYHALASHDRILELVTSLIGKDVLLWGASLVVRRPGQLHPWHTDMESSSPTGVTLSVWIGLANTNVRSSLKVVPSSHRFGITVQQVMQEEGRDRSGVEDADIAGWANERNGRSDVVLLNTFDGAAVFFDGRLWHGSRNLNSHGTRYALLLQYSTPATAIRIPNFQRAVWPFEFYQAPKPPCILVRGQAMNAPNLIVPAPAATHKDNLPSLSSRVHSLQLPLEQDAQEGWKAHHLFQGSTPNLLAMESHVSVLNPGRQPHPPHRHDEEEILIILDGEADLVLEETNEAGTAPRHRVRRGSFAYYPAGLAHTIANPSGRPVTYVMFKWRTDRGKQTQCLGHHLVSFSDGWTSMPGSTAGGLSQESVLDGQTDYLRHLHAHITRVLPGAGYEPHVDAHDVGIVVMTGTVETMDQRVGPNGVIFCAAGQQHGMRNVGEEPALYLVFEFHGRHGEIDLPYDARFSRRLWRVVRDPRRLGGAIGRRVRSAVQWLRARR